MALDKAIREEMRESVTIRQQTAVDEYGRETHDAGTVYEARVVEKSMMVYGDREEHLRADGMVWVAPDAAEALPTVTPGSTVLTLPDGSEPRVLAVDVYNQSGPNGELNHLKIWYGRAGGG